MPFTALFLSAACFCAWLPWSWLKLNYGAVSAIASGASVLIALWIGRQAFALNRNIRKGQVAHEQMQMLLEIDDVLIDRPELYAVLGKKHISPPNASKDLDEMLKTIQAGSHEQKAAVAQAIAIALSENPNASRIAELRKRAFTARFFNFFDILHGNYGKTTFWRLDPLKDEEWRAWREYIKDFFRDNEYAVTQWMEIATKKIYTDSFTEFMKKIMEEVKV